MRVLGGASTEELDEETRGLLHWGCTWINLKRRTRVVRGKMRMKNEQVEGDDMHTRYPAHEPSTLLIRTQQYLQALHHLFFSL